MLDNKSSSELGPVNVYTSNNRGHSPEEIAEMALNKIMMVSDSAPPVIRDQAIAQNRLKEVLILYMNKMAQSERTTIWALMKKQGQEDMAEIIRRL